MRINPLASLLTLASSIAVAGEQATDGNYHTNNAGGYSGFSVSVSDSGQALNAEADLAGDGV